MEVVLFAVGYKAGEIEQLQPCEIDNIIKGHDLAQEIIIRREAYFTLWNVAPHVKKGKVSYDKILKPILKRKRKDESILKQEKELLERALNG